VVQPQRANSAVVSTRAMLVAAAVAVGVDRTGTAACRNRLLAMPCQSQALNVEQFSALLLLVLLPLLLHLEPAALSLCCTAVLLLPQSCAEIPEKQGGAAAPASASVAVPTEVVHTDRHLEIEQHQGQQKQTLAQGDCQHVNAPLLSMSPLAHAEPLPKERFHTTPVA